MNKIPYWLILILALTVFLIPLAIFLFILKEKYIQNNLIDISKFNEFESFEISSASFENAKIELEKTIKLSTDFKNKVKITEDSIESYNNEIENLRGVEKEINKTIYYETPNVLDLEFEWNELENVNSKIIENTIKVIKEKQKIMKKNKNIILRTGSLTYNNSAAKGRTFQNKSASNLEKAFNNELKIISRKINTINYDSYVTYIDSIYDELNRAIVGNYIYINEEYKKLKVNVLFYTLLLKHVKLIEREVEMERREEAREEEKVKREILKKKDKLKLEVRKIEKIIKFYKEKLKLANKEEKKSIQIEIKKNEQLLIDLNDSEKTLDEKLNNLKVGVVYVLSNVESFGEGIYKIGMTRREDPNDRVKELGDASVPFQFKVHAFIHSKNAYALETKLHKHFADNKVNLVNKRKEYFYLNLTEIEKVVKENYNGAVEFKK
jgi:hypothetical protein